MSNELFLMFTTEFYGLDSVTQERIFREFHTLVYPKIYFVLRDHASTEDIIQESFLRAIKKAPLLKEKEKYERWLKKLTRNVTLNHLHKFKRNREELDVEMVFVHAEAAVSSEKAVTLEKEVELKLMKEAIMQYIAQLNPSYRQILAMKWLHHLSSKDMAAELGVTEGVVRQRLHRAREAIRQKLLNDWEG